MQAAKALKKAMESGNVQNLKEAIAAAKAQKVSHEAGKWQWLSHLQICCTLILLCKNQQLVAGGSFAACRMCWKLWINSLHWPQKYVLLLVDPAFQFVSLFRAS